MGNGGHMAMSVPAFAQPWIRLGRLRERERWHALGLSLLERSIARELSQMKDSCLHLIPTRTLDVRLPSFARVGQQQQQLQQQQQQQQQLQQLQPPQQLPSRAPIDRQESINVKPILISCLDTHSSNILEIIGMNQCCFVHVSYIVLMFWAL
jgi:hypothetical protein